MLYDSETRKEIIEIDRRIQALKAEMKRLEKIKSNYVFRHYHSIDALIAKRKLKNGKRNSEV